MNKHTKGKNKEVSKGHYYSFEFLFEGTPVRMDTMFDEPHVFSIDTIVTKVGKRRASKNVGLCIVSIAPP